MENKTTQLPSRASKKVVKKKKLKKAILLSFTILSISIIVLIIAFIWSVYRQIDDSLPVMSIAPVSTIDVDTKEEVPIVVPQEEQVESNAISMALIGLDSRSGGGGLNTDVMILVTLNPDTKKGHVISMPRDTKVSYTYEGKNYTKKVNAVYADGYEAARKAGADRNGRMLGGMERTKQALSEFYGVKVSYATTVNFNGFIDVIDTIGGIDVFVDMNMDYEDSVDDTNIHLKKGQQTLNGKNALDFVRFRQTNENQNASSDFERNERQARVIQAIMKKMVSLGGISKVNSVIREVAEDVNTDLPISEIEDLISTYITIKPENIVFTSLQGNWKSPYVYSDEAHLAEVKQYLQNIITE